MKKNIVSTLPDAEAEFDDPDTIRALQNVLESAGHAVSLFEASEDLPLRLTQNRPDIVFNIAEGVNGRGREAHVPAILQFLGIPFTGSDETTMCLAMDKALAKTLVAAAGLHTPKHLIVRAETPREDGSIYGRESGSTLGAGIRFSDKLHEAFHKAGLSWPVIVKPNAEGSSKGLTALSVVRDKAALDDLLADRLEAYKQDMLVEEYIAGREFTVGILGNGEDLRVFPPMEILFLDASQQIYSYHVKQNFKQYVQYACPPDIDGGVREEIERAAETVYRALGCMDVARVDFRLSADGRLCFIELNPLPGLAPGYSDLPILASHNGMNYDALVLRILDSALTRWGLSK